MSARTRPAPVGRNPLDTDQDLVSRGELKRRIVAAVGEEQARREAMRITLERTHGASFAQLHAQLLAESDLARSDTQLLEARLRVHIETELGRHTLMGAARRLLRWLLSFGRGSRR